MNSDAEKLLALINDENFIPDENWLRSLKERYPFFKAVDLMALRDKKSLTPSQRRELGAAMALATGSHEMAERLVEPDGDRFDNFYPQAPTKAVSTTQQAIDKFLATYGPADEGETEILERLIFNPVADYSQQLARDEENSLPDAAPTGNSRDDRINRFILSVKGEASGHDDKLPHETADADTTPAPPLAPKQRVKTAVKMPETPAENTLLSESLAKIYIKTRRYERAYEILNRLSLAFPEKNAYFADQLRFLRKLMLAESYRRKRADTAVQPE